MHKRSLLASLVAVTILFINTNRVVADGSSVTFQIINQQVEPLGIVIIRTPDSSCYATVLGANTCSVDITENATSVVIDGRVLRAGLNGDVILYNSKVIAVTWVSSNVIVITDSREIG